MRRVISDAGTLGQRILRQVVSGSVEEASPLTPATFDVETDLSDPDYDPPHPFFRDRFDEAESYHDARSVVDEITLGASVAQPAKADTSPAAAPSAEPTAAEQAGSD